MPVVATAIVGAVRRVDPLLLLIIGLAVLARVAAAHVIPYALLATPWEYEEVALNVLSGNGFLGTYHGVPYLGLVHPLYPLITAAVYGVVGHSSLLAMQVAQSAAVVPAAWLTFQLGSALGGRLGGLCAAAAVTLHPALLVFSLRRHSLWFDAIFFLATLVGTYQIRADPTVRRLVVLGALFGVGMLSRATVGVFLGVAGLWLAWQWRVPAAEWGRRMAIVGGVALIVVAPWLIRNAVVFQRPTGFVSTDGQNLWIGNNPAASGGALDAAGRDIVRIDPVLMAAIEGRTEMEQQRVYRQAAVEYIRAHPATAVVNYLRKLWIFLFWAEQTGAWYPSWFRTSYLAFYVLLLAATTVGGRELVRAGHGGAVTLCLALFASVGLLQSVFYVEGRHRWGVEAALLIVAASGIALRLSGASELETIEKGRGAMLGVSPRGRT
ncbi:MAG: hypothetical protein FJW14_11570 [Acidimicrobiia bacterium]|nr:hypothetical protein [Acidimicrobiia bacterium]